MQWELLVPYVMGIVRTFVASGGGWLIGQGVMDGKELDSFVGAAMIIVTVIWSLVHKYAVTKKPNSASNTITK